MTSKYFTLSLLLGLCVNFFTMPLFAHEGRPVYIQLAQMESSQYSLQWKTPPVMAAGNEPRISLSNNGCNIISGSKVGALSGRLYYQCSLQDDLSVDSRSVANSSVDSRLVEKKQAIEVVIRYPKDNPALSSLLVYKSLNGEIENIFSGPEVGRVTVAGERDWYEVAQQYLLGGAKHILAGYDHLLFVLCLLVLARTARQLLFTITGFTLAHSLTLALASLSVFSINTLLVEALIALSIVVLAAEIIKAYRNNKKESFTWRYPMVVSFLFGLLHGFGFSSVLTELGLPHEMKLNALVFFNLGIELGQLVFIAAVYFVLQLGMRGSRLFSGGQGTNTITSDEVSDVRLFGYLHSQYIIVAMYAVGAVGTYWLFERVVGFF